MLVLNAAFTRKGQWRRCPKAVIGRGMTASKPKPRQAGGVLLALGFTGGAAAGILLGEPSAGFLIGGGIGAVLALLIWWRDR
jgi:hypothetical protein